MTDYQDTVEFGGTGEFQGATAYPGWGYVQPVTVTNGSGGELTAFQVLVELTAETFDYASADADGADLRFTLADKLTTLSYWIEEWNYEGASRVWVKVDSIATGDSVIYLFYGNAEAESESSGSNGFPDFFDDFSGESLDTEKWTKKNGGTPSFESGVMSVAANATDPAKIIATGAPTGDNYILRSRFKINGGTDVDERIGLGIKTGTGDGYGYNYILRDFTSLDERSFLDDHVAWSVRSSAWSKDTWYIEEIVHDGTNVKGRFDDGEWQTQAWSGRSGYPALNIGSEDGNSSWDFALIRKYVATEPTCVLGSATSYGVGIVLALSLDALEIDGTGALTVASQIATEIGFSGEGAVSVAGEQQTLASLIEFGGTGAVNGPLAHIFMDISNFLVESWTVTKTIQDALWRFSGPIDKLTVPTYFKNFRAMATASIWDEVEEEWVETEHCIFLGFVPGSRKVLANAANKASLEGFDYGWYLSQQYVPVAQRQTSESTNPATTIKALLGGDQWENITGIQPYRVTDVADWDSETLPSKQFISDSKASKWKLIQEICEYTHHVFIVKWRENDDGLWVTSAYFVHEDDIDDAEAGLDLPATVTVTNPDPYLMGSVTVEDKQEDMINKVMVNGVDPISGTWYTATKESDGVAAGDELPIEYLHESTDLNTQDLTTAKATELYNFFHSVAQVYTASFKKRMDLQLYQKLSFVDYDEIPAGDMRITSITYSRKNAEDVVTVQFTSDQVLSDLKRLMRSMGSDFMNEQQRIKEDFFVDLTKIAVGTVTEIDGSEAIVQLEKDDGLVKARIL